MIIRAASLALLFLLALPAPLDAAPSDANGFAARVCSVFPRGGGGTVTSWRGLGCSWHYVDGKPLDSQEEITLTAHRAATPEQIAAYRKAEDGYAGEMARYGLATITPVGYCGSGAGRKAIITASPDLRMVSGYMVCGTHYISASMKLKPGTPVDPSRLFDDLMPLVLPLIGAKAAR